MDLSIKAWRLPFLFIAVLAVACSAPASPSELAAGPAQVTPAVPSVGPQNELAKPRAPGIQSGVERSIEKVTQNPLALRTPDTPPPAVDISISVVPVEDVVFDTFRGGFVRLSVADSRTIEALRDRIKPIYEPIYGPVKEGDWLMDRDLVIGYVGPDSGSAFAYPVKMLNLHEIVNDVIDGRPVLISYCPLCASGVVYDRELNGEVLLFGNTSALYQSDLVMYDHQTGSYWFQVLGEAIVGPLSGQRLILLPSVTVEWGLWKELYPDTQVLSRNLGLLGGGFGNPYARDSFRGYQEVVNSGRFAFPVDESKLDDRLLPGDRVIAVQVGQTHKAYRLTGSLDRVINDVVADRKIVIIIRDDGPSGFAYFADSDGRSLTFSLANGALVDDATKSQWDESGKAVSGELQGAQLKAVPSRTSFWFSLVGSLPGIELHVPN
ncbi:MAG: DUF3179 domain-containing protein [Chloroflexi bacterium]|nr:DUF3179 domain-containing protein [Chloroflexota bacterium]